MLVLNFVLTQSLDWAVLSTRHQHGLNWAWPTLKNHAKNSCISFKLTTKPSRPDGRSHSVGLLRQENKVVTRIIVPPRSFASKNINFYMLAASLHQKSTSNKQWTGAGQRNNPASGKRGQRHINSLIVECCEIIGLD